MAMRPTLKAIRLALSGAIVGAAAAGLLASYFGVGSDAGHLNDVLGAVVGSGTAIVLIKILHLV